MQPPVIRACNDLTLAARWLTPFLRISQSVPPDSRIRQFLEPYEPEKRPVVLQLMGVDPVKMAASARAALALGAAGIDLNLGCPSRQVTRHGAGAGSLRSDAFARTLAVAAALREAVPEGGFSIKMRIGWSDPADFPHLLAALMRASSPDRVTVHYRTAQEGYRPVAERMARFRLIAGAARACGVTFLLNGDIGDPDEARRLCAVTGASGVMIGRGFWRDPYILRRLETPDAADLPTPEAARQKLWRAILRRLAESGAAAARGKAVELSHLILGVDSAAARELRAMPDGDFPAWLARQSAAGGT